MGRGNFDSSFYQQYGYNDHWDFAQQNSQVYQGFGQMAQAMNNSFIWTDFFSSGDHSYMQRHDMEGTFEVAAANYKLWTQKSEDYQFGQHFQGNETQDINWWNDQYAQISSAHGKSQDKIDRDLIAFRGKTPTSENDVSPTEAYEYLQKDMQNKTIAIINENIRKRNLLRKIVSVNNDKGISISSEELESMKKYATLYDLQRILHKDSEPLSYHQNMVAKMAVLLKGIEATVVTIATLGLTTEAFVSEEIIAASITKARATGTALKYEMKAVKKAPSIWKRKYAAQVNPGKLFGQYADDVSGAADDITGWLGKKSKVVKNSHGDTVIISEDGLRKVRFDLKYPNPHKSPHFHMEYKQSVDSKWIKSGPIYPKDVIPK